MPLFAILCLTLSVHDGDTIRCNDEKVRIANIDAPELPGSSRCHNPRASRKNPPWCDYSKGAQSRDALRNFTMRGKVSIVREGRDRYGRTLARVYVGEIDAGQWLVKRGLARPWVK